MLAQVNVLSIEKLPSLKGNGIAILSVLLSSTSCICVKVIAECTIQFSYISTLSLVYSSFPRCLYQRRWRERCFPKKQKKEVMKSKSTILEAQCRWLPEKTKNSAKSRRKGREEGLKVGRSASKAARKTTVRQVGRQSLSS